MRLGQAKDRTIQKYLETSSKLSVLVQFEARSEERIAILSNTVTRNRSLQHTACGLCRESGMHENKGGAVPQGIPRIILKPNSQSGQQEQPDQEARKSSDHQSASERSYGETRSGNVDYGIPGIPHSAVQRQDTSRRETVKKLIQQFENHPNKESFVQDLKKTEEIYTFIEKSKKFFTDMGNREISELCETSSEKQCDCALYWEIDIVYCLCGRCLEPSQTTKKLDKKNHDASSIPGYVIQKNLTGGAKHGASERQRM